MKPETGTDEQLMGEFSKTGDETAINELVSKYTAQAVSFASFMLNGRSEAEDAVQETFLRIVRNRRKFKTKHTFKSWFYTILRNVCIDMQRKSRPVQPEQFFEPETAENGGSADLLEILEPGEQSLLHLKLVHGYSLRDIAEYAGCSAEAAKKRCQRALARLREKLKVSSETGNTKSQNPNNK